jgi:hypothetical protein
MLRAALCAAVLLAAAGCGAEPDDRPVSFTYIWQAILVPNCTTSNCHSALTTVSGFGLEDRDEAYDVLSDSLLDSVIRGVAPDKPRMPPDQPLPQADIDLIINWVLAGKPNN